MILINNEKLRLIKASLKL